MFWFTCDTFHYKKIDKYKQKYRKNISLVNCWRILPMKIFPRYLLRELQWKKKFKTKQKKNDVGNSVSKIIDKLSILFIMWITKGIIDGTFRRYFTESSETIHFPIALLITVLYKQNHRRIEKLSVLFDDFLKNLN
jgi:hypothetical protein